ncbi:hypothetical protein CPC08DRAFT_122129 [Agrocybe pediades]|nr:hypothetical protein CPC08DRAFT_122129 [Agrocybe pediades]
MYITSDESMPISLFPEFSRTLPAVLRFSVMCASYTIYDYVCTVDKEIEHVWTCPWSMGLILFYLNRYLPFIEVIFVCRRLLSPTISQGECLWVYPLTIWLQTIGMIIPQVIVILRTYAIWGCRLIIFRILAALSMVTFSSMVAFTGWQTAVDYHRLHSIMVKYDEPLPNNIKCQVSVLPFDTDNNGLILLNMYLVVFISEAVVFVLTIIKAKQHLTLTSDLW